MKKRIFLLLSLVLGTMLAACGTGTQPQVAATTLPVYQFTAAITDGTPVTVTRLVTESVSCLHDYSMTVNQMRSIEGAEVVVISGAGLEEFMDEALANAKHTVDASEGVQLLEGGLHHGHEHKHEQEHVHETDPHIWLSPENAMTMAKNISAGLSQIYPEHQDTFQKNLEGLLRQLQQLKDYGSEKLGDLTARELITFHDGFGYLAHAYDLTILEAIEEEAGSEVSADELTHLIELVQEHSLPAIFTESNGSTSAASVISASTNVPVFTLDMAMSGDDYFAAMYHNIDTLREALQ